MRRYTDRYHKARLAEARPIFLLFLGTDRGLRCFGKHTPTPEQIGTELSVLEWSARVLTFGDFRQSLSSDSDSAIKNLYEEEMSSLSCTLDNADGYFSRIAGREVFLDGDVSLYQGFDYPEFSFSDFQEFFTGNTVKVEFDKTSVTVTANAAAQTPPADPPLTSSTIYALTTGGAGEVGAQETYTYAETQPVFYTETWIFITEITVITTGTEPILFDVSNDKYNQTRFQIGLDASNHVYLKYTDNVNTATPTYNIMTSDVVIGAGDSRISVEYDETSGTVTIKDNTGQVDIIIIPTSSSYTYDSVLTTPISNPRGVHIDSSGNVFVADYGNNAIQKFSSSGSHQLTISGGGMTFPYDVSVDSFGNIWALSGVASPVTVYKYNSSGTFQSSLVLTGLASPRSIAIDSNDYIWAIGQTGSTLAIKYDALGSSIATITAGTADGTLTAPFGIAIGSLNNIYISDESRNNVQYFSSSGAYINKFGTSGSGDGQFSAPKSIEYADSMIFVADNGNDRVQYFNTAYAYQGEFGSYGSGSGQFLDLWGVAVNTDGDAYVSDRAGPTSHVQKFDKTETDILIDDSDTGSDDTITIAEDFDGETVTSSFNGAEYVNTNPTNTEFPDIGEDIDLTVVDGTWTEALTIQVAEEIIITTPLDPTEELIVETTELYEHAGPNQQNVPLPYPYGNLRENSDAGVWVCPLINQDDFVYCVAGWPIQSVANGNTVQVYVDGLEVTSGWTFSESTDYQGKGDIAILTFSSDPDGVVTVSCNGKWVDGQLLTNPVDIIEDFLDWAAELIGSTTWNRDLTSFAQAKALTIANGYAAAGVIQANNSVGYWVKSILKCFLGNFRINSNGDISLTFQPLSQSREVFDRLNEYDAITVKAKQIFDNICGRIIINYAVNYADIDKRYKEGGESAYFRTADKSQAAINPQSWSLDFDWCRKTSNIETIQNILLDLYAQPEYIIDYQGQDFKFVPLDLLDQIQAEISFLLDSSGVPVQDVVYSLQHKTVNLDNFTTTMSLQSVNFIDAQKVEAGQVRIGGVDVQIGGVFVTFGT